MAARRLNPRRARTLRTYSVGETAALYGVHRNTVRDWLKAGLAKLGTGKPILIHGAELRRFLEGRRASQRRPCGAGHLFCLGCRAPRRPAERIADYAPGTAITGNLSALCGDCGALMYRRIRIDQIAVLFPEIEVRIMQVAPRLRHSPTRSLNYDIETGET